MTRIEEVTPEAVVVSRQDYESDKARGYAMVEFAPKGKLVIRNPRNPARTFEKEIPAVIMFRCMRCKFDVIDSQYTAAKEGHDRNGKSLMDEHLFRGEHNWSYTPFDNPYGNVEDVTIEGVEDYTKEIE